METKIRALLNLIDDPEESVFLEIQRVIISIGTAVIPDLKELWDNTDSILVQERVHAIVDNIRFDEIKKEFIKCLSTEDFDMLEALFIITKIEFPNLQKEEIVAPISQLCFDTWLEVRPNLTSTQLNKTLKHTIFNKHNFQANRNRSLDLKYLLLNTVCSSKIGDDIALGIIYLYVAQMVEMPMHAVNLDGIFVLMCSDKKEDVYLEDVDFFVSPYLGGLTFSLKQFGTFIRKDKTLDKGEKLNVLSNKDVVTIFLNRLEYIYKIKENERKKTQIQHLANLINN